MSNTKEYGAVFLIRLIYAVMQILMKATFNEGMSTSVFVFYRQAVATLFLVPVAFLLERSVLFISVCSYTSLFFFRVRIL